MSDFIKLYESSVDKEFCKKVLDWFNKVVSKGLYYTSKNDGRNLETRKATDKSFFLPKSVIEKGLDDGIIPFEWIEEYYQKIMPLVRDYQSEFSIECDLHSPNFKIHQVEKGQGYHVFHSEVENNVNTNRVLAYMTYIEKPDEGGETEFLFQHKRVKPQAGTTLIWPAYFTHLHRGNPVLAGRKTYLTGWLIYA